MSCMSVLYVGNVSIFKCIFLYIGVAPVKRCRRVSILLPNIIYYNRIYVLDRRIHQKRMIHVEKRLN